MPSRDPKRMSQIGRLGAASQHAKHDTRATTRAARNAFLARFEREVDPDNALPPAERYRRAEAAKRAYFQRLSMLAADAKKAKRQG